MPLVAPLKEGRQTHADARLRLLHVHSAQRILNELCVTKSLSAGADLDGFFFSPPPPKNRVRAIAARNWRRASRSAPQPSQSSCLLFEQFFLPSLLSGIGGWSVFFFFLDGKSGLQSNSCADILQRLSPFCLSGGY